MPIHKPAISDGKAMLVYEEIKDIYVSETTAGTTALQIPSANLEGRKGLIVQNLHASNTIHLKYQKPEILCGSQDYIDQTGLIGTRKLLKWTASGSGTSEYYATLVDGSNPSLSTPGKIYGVTSSGGSEGLLTEGTLGALNNLEWKFGNNDSLGFNTVYFRLNAGDPDSSTVAAYLVLLSYPNMPTTATGLRLASYEMIALNLASSIRLFCIASGASTTVVTAEYI